MLYITETRAYPTDPWATFMGPAPAVELDQPAIEAAVEELGLKFDVEIRMFQASGIEFTPLGLTDIDLREQRWVIYLDTSQPEEPDERLGPGVSATIWHELGHAQDFEQRFPDKDPIHMWLEIHGPNVTGRIRPLMQRIRDAQTDEEFQAARALYAAGPEEQYANKVAEAHEGQSLVIPKEVPSAAVR